MADESPACPICFNGHLHAEEEPEEEESLAGTASGFALGPKGSDGSLPRVCAWAVLRLARSMTKCCPSIQGWKMDTSCVCCREQRL